MIAPCTGGLLAKWAKDSDVPIVERDGGYMLGSGSISDPRLTIHFSPFCGEHGWPDRGKRPCKCGVIKSLVENYPELLGFDAEMNEFHVVQLNPGGRLQIHYCIACGGNPPQSFRRTFFEAPSTLDYEAAWARIKNLKDEVDSGFRPV